MSRFVFALLAAWALLNSQAAAQTQGNQNLVRLPGAIDVDSRITGIGYSNQYYIAYNDNSNGLSGGEYPSVYYGNVTSSGSNPPVPGFQDAGKVAIPGLGGDTNRYHQAAAVLAGAPYIFQFSCSRNGSPILLKASYEKMIAPVVSGTAPTFTTAANVSNSIISALGNVFDVAAATLNSRMYVFVLRGDGSNPDSISVLSYGGQGSGGPELESSYTLPARTWACRYRASRQQT